MDMDMDNLMESDFARFAELKSLYENGELTEAEDFYELEALHEGYGLELPSNWVPTEDIEWLNEEEQ